MTPTEWPHFYLEELRCPHCGEMHMDSYAMSRFVTLRKMCGFPWKISSAYRCPEYNAQISSTGPNGPHTTGKAMDIVISHDKAFELIRLAMQMGIQRIGVKQKGPSDGRFIHLDWLTSQDGVPAPRIWSY